MTKHFSSFQDVISDDDFLAWHANPHSAQGRCWQQFLEENPQYRPLAEECIHLLKSLPPEQPVAAVQHQHAFQRLMKAVAAEAPVVPLRRSRWWLSAAAAVLLLVCGTWLWSSRGAKPVALQTTYGQVAQYTLPDGSSVMLNANSKLELKKSFKENGNREVWLKGEAFFHVKKTATRNRFIVHTDAFDIIVTGTQFNVVNRDGENNVLLKEGSIILKTAGKESLKLQPGDFVKIEHARALKALLPQEKVLAWTQAKLVFEDTPLASAAKTISEHYGLKVTVGKEVEDKRLSGILPNNNLDVLLEALEAMNLKITRTPQEITITTSQP